MPLALVRCQDCCLPQLSVDVPPEALYDADYPYFSSVSPELNRHFAGLAQEIIARHAIGAESRVLEAASNDGYLLRHFAAVGAEVTGYDPARGPAEAAIARGIPTRIAFFGQEAARAFVGEHGPVDLFLANNVLAHVPDLQGFVAGIAEVLRPGGVAVLEVPYLVDLVERRAFDTIYHQHLCYFPLTSLEALFERAGLGMVRVTRHAVHGGSLRLELGRGAKTSVEVARLIQQEREAGHADADFVARIGEAARLVRQELRDLVAGIRAEGGTIWAYGAAAKGNTLLAICGLGRDSIEAVADLNPHKHGRYMPGSDLPIAPPEALVDARPSHVLILAWNLRDEILGQLSPLRAGGTRFILPIPRPELVS